MVKLRTLGECVAEIGETRLGPDAERLFAVLLCLGVEGDRLSSRSALTSLLWPDAPEDRGGHSLRQSVYRLRALGVPVRSDRSNLWIEPESLELDCAALLGTVSEAPTVVEQLRGSFLPGYHPKFSDRYGEWVERQRDLVNARIRRVFLAEIARLKSRGDWAGVECMAARCLAIDPFNEEATLAKAEAAALQGGKTQALAILDGYLKEVGPQAREIRLPASVLRRRIAEATHLERPRAITETPFFGRAVEMALLNRALQMAHAGTGSAHLFWGEPGIGKTRLMQEFSRALSLGHAQLVRVGCQSNDDRRPLSMFVDMLPRLLSMPGALGCAPGALRHLRRLIEHDPTEPLSAMDPRDAAMIYARIRTSLLDLVDAVAAEGLLVLIIEDVHWLDMGSWDVIADALSWLGTRRVLLLLTAREPDAERKRGIGELPGLQRHHLAPLDRDAVDALSATIVARSGTPLAPDVAEWCATSCGGNPYHLTELVLHALREGRTAKLPASLTQLIGERLGRLQPLSLHVLQGVSVLGAHSTLDRLERLLDQRRLDLLEALDELERSGLIESEPSRLLSKHELLSQAAVQRLSVSARRLLHRHAAEVLERDASSERAPAMQWACAEHWREAGEVGRALSYLQECARYALESGALDDAIELIDRAMSLARTEDDRDSLQSMTLRSHFARGNWRGIVSLAETIQVARANRVPNYDGHDDEELIRLESRWRAGGSVSDQLNQLESCILSHDSSLPHKEKAAVLGLILCDNERDAQRAKNIYDSVQPTLTKRTVERLIVEIVFQASFGDLSQVEVLVRELLALLSEGASVQARVRSAQICSYALRSAGLIREAYSIAREGYSLAARHRFPAGVASLAVRLAGISYVAGRLEDCNEWIARAEGEAKLLRDFHAADYLGLRIRLALRRGETANLRESYERFSSDTLANESARCRAERWGFIVRARMALEDYCPSEAELRVAHHLATLHLNACWADHFIAAVCLAHAQCKDHSTAKRVLEEYLRKRRDRYPLAWEIEQLAVNR